MTAVKYRPSEVWFVVALKETTRLTEETRDLTPSWPVGQTKQRQRGAAAEHCARSWHNHSCAEAVVDSDPEVCYTGATVGRCSVDSKEVET
jgi:hypothetical protein